MIIKPYLEELLRCTCCTASMIFWYLTSHEIKSWNMALLLCRTFLLYLNPSEMRAPLRVPGAMSNCASSTFKHLFEALKLPSLLSEILSD